MKIKMILLVAIAFSLAFLVQRAAAANTNDPTAAESKIAPTNCITAELNDLDQRVRLKFKAASGHLTESDLTNELKELDSFLEQHKDGNKDDLANLVFFKAAVYKLVLHEPARYDALVAQIVRNYPDSQVAQRQKHGISLRKSRADLAVGKQFPDFDEKDLAGEPVSVARYKRKIVLLDFWATWCGPCKAELPNVQKIYKEYHDQGFEIVGVSLDSDGNKLKTFIEQQKMPWPQYFDGQGWKNKLAVKYGVEAIPATYLLDGEGKIIGVDLRGEDLASAVATAVAKK